MAGSIGIKQANGNFYSILEENSAAKKRLVLTTVHDGQKSVQIDLYRSLSKTMADAAYIGSIVVEDISEKPKGEPSIEMNISSTQDGSISASAVDLANPGNEQHLSISLKSLEDDKNDYPDFEVETRPKKTNEYQPPSRKFPWIALIIIGLILALICLGLWYFLFRSKEIKPAVARESPPAVVKQTEPPPQGTEPEPAPQKAEPAPPAPVPQVEQRQPVIVEAPPPPKPQAAPRTRTPAPVYSFNVPQTIPPEGIVYKIRWGDTLWDISEAFYRNPHLYTFIVRSNKIRNPNQIVSGTELTILPRD